MIPHMYGFYNLITNNCIPRILLEPYLPPKCVQSFKDLESRYIHEGWTVDPSLVAHEHIDRAFRTIGFENLLTIKN